MKYYFDGIIVAEGSSDSAYLSSFIESMYVLTKGYAIEEDEIDFITHSNKEVLLLVDPDEAGKKIREKLNSLIPNCHHVEVNIDKCNKNGKHGVAECENEEIIRVLKGFLLNTAPKYGNLTSYDLLALGVDSSEKREKLSHKLHLGKCNNKQMIKRINFLCLGLEDIKKALNS